MADNECQPDVPDENQIKHALVSSWFLGPRAENVDVLQTLFGYALNRQQQARRNLAQDDDIDKDIFITQEMKDLDIYKESIKTLTDNTIKLSNELAAHSVPFWSPRYNAHMNMDTTMASVIGYMSAMIYNPNNVATEASPLTTKLERDVGLELCGMLGYNVHGPKDDPAAPWGHITCDGSVANLEAIWAIRNLKFYPFSLKQAIEEGPLKFLSTVEPPFTFETCNGGSKPFVSLSKDELLNLTPSKILSIPTILGEKYSITPNFLQSALKPFLIQSTGKEKLEKKYDINPGKFMISATKHYSWPKGGAISGLGSDTFVDIAVDNEARMNIDILKKELDKCIETNTPIFGVVAIMGSTEHGACDPLAEIIQVRNDYQKNHGVSFAIHCDAAWGGYFASMLRSRKPRGPGDFLPYVPAMPLSPYTAKQLQNLKDADSITIDPHKSGYINYPAGGLCYRDGRMRYLVTWTSPIVFHEGDDVGSMGVYGVEGSKPGASAVATWLTHQSLGLDEEGYGRLLGEAIFSCAKLYCHWATMTPRPEHPPEKDRRKGKRPDAGVDKDALIVVPLIRLPSEQEEGEDVEAQKDYIRKEIIGRDNMALYEDEKAWDLMCKLGGDLMINAFATNFKIDGKVNQDVGEANYLNQWIFSKLSISSKKDVIKERPLFLTSSEFSEEAYGECLNTFKHRLGLTVTDNCGNPKPASGDLRFLVNVTMSPWPTSPDFMTTMVEDFRSIAEHGVKRCIKRNKRTPDIHGFVVQGLDKLYFSHIAMFNMANHRKQLIIAADLPEHVHAFYKEQRKENPGQFYTIANMDPHFLEDLVEGLVNPDNEYKFRLDKAIPANGEVPPLKKDFVLRNVRVIVNQSMAYPDLDKDYPDKMPFYIYGNKTEIHVDHVLKCAPNAQITADLVKSDLGCKLSDEQLEKGLVVVLDDVFEKSLQALPTVLDKTEHHTKRILTLDAPGLSLTKGFEHKASVYETYENAKCGENQPIAAGTISLGETVFADWDAVNMDGAEEH
ncbi:pyridoxal phosphate-dependent transferase [Podospora fimiseda]|uniref:Pyridoxal phosphate-dependent transferase n=1 Tax=Podospora fimiseda TaxID=252190 RepID=A0AAN7GQI5_9PEZI|nr:pyridoxal phosphate-dependent transferase [Podospora fimiseda]